MKKNISRNPLWPDWYNGKKIDEVQFGRALSLIHISEPTRPY